MRLSAGVSSSKKLVTSRDTWYCCRKSVILVLKKRMPGVIDSETFMDTVTTALEMRPVCAS